LARRNDWKVSKKLIFNFFKKSKFIFIFSQSPTSYVPQPFLKYTDRMTFKQRLLNTLNSLIEKLAFNFYHLRKQRQLYQKYFPNAKKSFDEMFKSSAVIFRNSHISTSTPRSSMPNVIDIAGIHLKPVKPLPADIQQFLDSATDGVILFSMGSFIKSKDLPVEKREAFVNAFRKLKLKVLWKYENETLPNKPENIKISSWLPQRDILGHKNVKLFITHGGFLGTTEALVQGIPVLGIPIFGDQKMNMKKAEERGFGSQLFYDEITEEKVSSALENLLTNPKFKENAEIMSMRFNDRPMTPQDAVNYWTEYAVRHNGAKHLRAAANDLNFIELNLIDVYATLLIIFVLILLVDILILKIVLRKICRKILKQKKDKKN
jgi:UDP:flavonoid glycosyltransferase YjiC (YdhE family)